MGKSAFPPLPTRPQLVLAVYPALLTGHLVARYVCSLPPLTSLYYSAALCFATLALLARYIHGLPHSLCSLLRGTVYGKTTTRASGGPNFRAPPRAQIHQPIFSHVLRDSTPRFVSPSVRPSIRPPICPCFRHTLLFRR